MSERVSSGTGGGALKVCGEWSRGRPGLNKDEEISNYFVAHPFINRFTAYAH